MYRFQATLGFNRFFLAIGLLLTAALLAAGCSTDSGPVGVIYPDGSRRVTPEQAKMLVDQGRAVLGDVRSLEQFKQAHPVGAISTPASEVADWRTHPALAGLPAAKKEVILYCT